MQNSNTPIALISEEEMLAPFAVYCEDTKAKLLQMGVINKKEDLHEPSIKTLASAFAVEFYNSFLEFSNGDLEVFDFMYSAIYELWMKKEPIGIFYYIVLTCGIMECPVPKQFLWIACRDDALNLYIQKFMDVVQELIEDECSCD